MSADNTIGILITRGRKGPGGLEYRVAETGAIENIEYAPDYPSAVNPVLNRESVLLVFCGAPVFFDKEAAWKRARRLETQSGYVEYDIVEFDFSKLYFPASEAKLRRRAIQRSRYQALRATVGR